MVDRAPRRWTFLFCLWLSLATVFAHAVLPAGSPLARGQGSAFSIATTDVSLAPSRRNPTGTGKSVSRSLDQPDAASGPDRPDPSAVGPAAAALPHPLPRASGLLPQAPGRAGSRPMLAFRARAPPTA